jgi:hypothetical protein
VATVRSTPIRRRSAKKRAEENARAVLRRELFEERGPWCQGGCGRYWSEMHEVLSRGRGGDPLDKHNILCLCLWCHHAVTANPAKAEEYGYSRSATPDEQPSTRKLKRGLK